MADQINKRLSDFSSQVRAQLTEGELASVTEMPEKERSI
jgi:hypothetical protein